LATGIDNESEIWWFLKLNSQPNTPASGWLLHVTSVIRTPKTKKKKNQVLLGIVVHMHNPST
jgi:hypothetical protein